MNPSRYTNRWKRRCFSIKFKSNVTSATSGSSSVTLLVAGSLTYTATYTIQQAAAYTGSVINRATVTASSPGNLNDVSDVSDDPNTPAAVMMPQSLKHSQGPLSK